MGMFDLDLTGGINSVMNALKPQFEVVKHICKNVVNVYEVLSREYGVPPNGDDSRFQPRSQTRMPLIIEETIAAGATKEFDLEKLNQSRLPSRGYYRNIGNDPFKATLIGADGQSTGLHTLLSKDTIAITNYVARIAITAGTTPVTVQIFAQ